MNFRLDIIVKYINLFKIFKFELYLGESPTKFDFKIFLTSKKHWSL